MNSTLITNLGNCIEYMRSAAVYLDMVIQEIRFFSPMLEVPKGAVLSQLELQRTRILEAASILQSLTESTIIMRKNDENHP